MAAGERAPARRLRASAAVTVLVDPQDPACAEYPGRPYPLPVAVLFLSVAGVFALLFIFAVWRLAVIRFRNRRLPRPQPGQPADSSPAGIRLAHEAFSALFIMAVQLWGASSPSIIS
jgi:hypothetical protein